MAATAAMSDYLGQKVLDWSLSDTSTAFPSPANLWIGFTTAAVTATMTGATVTEPSEGSTGWQDYARFQIVDAQLGGASKSASGTSSEKSTTSEWEIDSAASCSQDVNIVGWFIADNASVGAGNIHWFGALASTVTVQHGNRVAIPSGSLTLQISRIPAEKTG